MRKVISAFKTIRNNWKKSLVATLVLGYGLNYGNIQYNNRRLLRKYCMEASKLGDVSVRPGDTAYRVTVILNSKANQSKAVAEYEQYCFPLLHLSGAQVKVILIKHESEIRNLMDSIPLDVDALIIAGGNGTISETLTGLLRRVNGDIFALKNLPIGILPVGKTNSLAKKLYTHSSIVSEDEFIDASDRVRLMAEATFAAINNQTKTMDIMKIENLEGETFRPVYSVGDITWGSFRDARAVSDKYRYFAKLRSYLSYVVASYRRDKPIKANVTYYTPCTGCKHCYQNRTDLTNEPPVLSTSNVSRRWWQVWVPSPRNDSHLPVNYDAIDNPSCRKEERTIETINLNIVPSMLDHNPCLVTNIGPTKMSYTEFVKEGWKMLKNFGYQNIIDYFYARQLVIEPIIEEGDGSLFSIDGEEYEAAPIKVTLLTNAINIFRSPLPV